MKSVETSVNRKSLADDPVQNKSTFYISIIFYTEMR